MLIRIANNFVIYCYVLVFFTLCVARLFSSGSFSYVCVWVSVWGLGFGWRARGKSGAGQSERGGCSVGASLVSQPPSRKCKQLMCSTVFLARTIQIRFFRFFSGIASILAGHTCIHVRTHTHTHAFDLAVRCLFFVWFQVYLLDVNYIYLSSTVFLLFGSLFFLCVCPVLIYRTE